MHFSSSLSLSASDLDLGRTLLPLLLPRGKRRRPRRGGRRTGGRRRRPQQGRTRAQRLEAAPLVWRAMPPVVGGRAQQRGRAGPVRPQLAAEHASHGPQRRGAPPSGAHADLNNNDRLRAGSLVG